MIDHLVVKLVLLSLSCQMYFDNSVLLERSTQVNIHPQETFSHLILYTALHKRVLSTL